jgi:hypothetical protein
LSFAQSHWSSQFVIYCLVSVCPLVYCVCHFEDAKVCAVSILKFLLNFFVRCI